MNRFDTYRDGFSNARLTRSESGVLEVALHTNGGTLVFDGIPMNSSSICFTRSVRIPVTAWSS